LTKGAFFWRKSNSFLPFANFAPDQVIFNGRIRVFIEFFYIRPFKTPSDLDKAIIIQRVADILKETPSAQDIVKKGPKRNERFLYLARHMVEKAIAKDALITSHGGLGIAILFRTNAKDKNFWKEILDEIGLVRKVTGVKNALKILKNQKYIKKQRPKEGDYLYCWFWGIVKDDRGPGTQIAASMKDELLRISEKEQLPIYAETRLKTNAVVYRRYKFELFHTWKQPDGATMWFLRYIPKSLQGKK